MADAFRPAGAGKPRSKPGQWKLVGGLAAVLAFLMFSGGDEETDEELAPKPYVVPAATSATPEAVIARREITWPIVPLEFLLTNNPFQTNNQKLRMTPAAAVEQARLIAEAEAAAAAAAVAAEQTPPTPTPEETAMAAARSAAELAQSLADKKVSVVVVSSKEKTAIINGKIYHEGDRIGDFQIAAIRQDGVQLRPADVSGAAKDAGSDQNL